MQSLSTSIIKSISGLPKAEVKKLHGYDNANYLIESSAERYVFKTYAFTEETFARIEAENNILFSLEKHDEHLFPVPVPLADRSYATVIDTEGHKTICRMLTFVEGAFFGETTQTKDLFTSFGAFLARMDLQLEKLNNDTIRARQWEWHMACLHLNKKYIDDIRNVKDRNIARYFFQQFEEKAVPLLPQLRQQLIHNDANEWNVLVHKGNVAGIIDFGDMAYAPLINEPAVAIAYACYDKENPLDWASLILESYHQLVPLDETDVKVLYYLIAGRLLTSVCNAAHSRKINPENTYALVSEKPAWEMLYRWLRINPVAAENQFRKDIGLPIEEPQSPEEMIRKRHHFISPALSISYNEPVHMVGAAFQYMYDAYGNTFLDAYNNIPHVGHAHPKVVQAGQRQMAQLNTNTRYLYVQLAEYADKLLSKFPSSLNKVFFVNSGSAASDLAISIARMHTGHHNIMVMQHGYHGHTVMDTDISDYKFSHPRGQGQKAFILKAHIPDTYKGKYTDARNAGRKYAIEAISLMAGTDDPIAAFISEPVVGAAGQVPLAPGYLKEMYPAIRKQGGVCISDEVQTGFGRLGDHFWGFEQQGVVPDIVILGKPMGNGHPMGAVVTTNEVADSFAQGVEFFSSFGGNPVSCAIGAAVLDVIEEEELQANARMVGSHYKMLLQRLQEKYACIGDVRGSGLFLGVEIVKENTKEPDTKLAGYIKNELRKHYILISTDGPFDNVLKSKPPMCFTKENAERVCEVMDYVLENYSIKNT